VVGFVFKVELRTYFSHGGQSIWISTYRYSSLYSSDAYILNYLIFKNIRY
jgi:hypothetical protein